MLLLIAVVDLFIYLFIYFSWCRYTFGHLSCSSSSAAYATETTSTSGGSCPDPPPLLCGVWWRGFLYHLLRGHGRSWLLPSQLWSSFPYWRTYTSPLPLTHTHTHTHTHTDTYTHRHMSKHTAQYNYSTTKFISSSLVKKLFASTCCILVVILSGCKTWYDNQSELPSKTTSGNLPGTRYFLVVVWFLIHIP